MTVSSSSTTARKTYAGDAATTSFDTTPMIFFDAADLVVYVTNDTTGASETLTLNTDYTVSGGSGTVGSISTSGLYGTVASGSTLVIDRSVVIKQESDFANNDNSDADVVERAFDRLTLICQELSATADRSVRLADSDVSGADVTLPTPEAGALVGWNSAGDALVNYSATTLSSGDTLVSAFMLTVLDDSSAANACATLGAINLSVENQVFAGGIEVTSKDLGTVSSGTVTPDPGDRPLQHYTNNGAHTLAPSATKGSVLLDITNGASAGAITTSGFTKVIGDAFTTTNGNKFRCHLSVGNGGSLLSVQALQ